MWTLSHSMWKKIMFTYNVCSAISSYYQNNSNEIHNTLSTSQNKYEIPKKLTLLYIFITSFALKFQNVMEL